MGNTSTDVEKTPCCAQENDRRRKHLHGRGEDSARTQAVVAIEETPPRTWRRPSLKEWLPLTGGNTSTDVEKTHCRQSPNCAARKHLHGRGEDSPKTISSTPRLETPPRTWRRPKLMPEPLRSFRNTSTDVEKTKVPQVSYLPFEKHLHGRGEDASRVVLPWTTTETPPRTWRRPLPDFVPLLTCRNTSTDVEKTYLVFSGNRVWEKHLHGRGEDPIHRTTGTHQLETPPRTWRRQQDLALSHFS